MPSFDLSSNAIFRHSVRAAAYHALKQFYGDRLPHVTMADIARDQVALRAYPNLDQLRFTSQGSEVITIRGRELDDSMRREAIKIKLAGQDFIEHSAGGDAVRLGMGAKYLLLPEHLVRAMEINNALNAKKPVPFSRTEAERLQPISLGNRHMLQVTYDLEAACPPHLNSEEVLKSQVMLVTLNQKTSVEIIREFVRYGFFGFKPENVLFMVDNVYPGMKLGEDGLAYIQASEMKLYNHGQMVMQEAIDRQIFRVSFDQVTGDIRQDYLESEEFGQILRSMANKTSYPIEDNDFLTKSIDQNSLAISLMLGRQSYRMIVEVTKQKEENPQKGGFWAFDPVAGRGVLIESDSGGSRIDNNDPASLAQIKHLNRNFNMFPYPFEVWDSIRQMGLPYPHLTVKDGLLYLQPPQGDLNFLVRTAFIQKEELKPINNLKELQDAPRTILAMLQQDLQKGFLDLAKRFGLIR